MNYQPPRVPGEAAQRASRTGWVGAASGTGRIAGASPVRARTRARRIRPAATGVAGNLVISESARVLVTEGEVPYGIHVAVSGAAWDLSTGSISGDWWAWLMDAWNAGGWNYQEGDWVALWVHESSSSPYLIGGAWVFGTSS